MTDAQKGPLAATALRAIALYQAARSGRPTACRYHPSCSQYATTAIERHGLWRGGRLAIARFARCTPLGSHGIDEVPPAAATVPR